MKESEIRPQKLFDEYLKLAEIDTQKYFGTVAKNVIECPACGTKGEFSFEKFGFHYESCPKCKTLFVNPRPVESAFEKYYTEAESTKFWATTFYKVTSEARREKIWKPKARLIHDILSNIESITLPNIIDIGGGYGIFAEEMQSIQNNPVTVIEPGPGLAQACRDKGLNVIQKFLNEVKPDDLPHSPKVFVSFELFEHVYSPETFLKDIFNLMSKGDQLIFTTLSGTGVDIQTLWEASKSVFPPHHLNFLNPISVKTLLEKLNFNHIEVTTPGKLDIDIMKNNLENVKDRFWRTFLETATEQQCQEWQTLITKSGWSSHMMVVCQK